MVRKIVSFIMCTVFAFTVLTVCFPEANTAEAASSSYTPYYYDQLNNNAKIVYNELKKAALKCNDKVRLNVQISKEDFDQVTELLGHHDAATFNIKNIEANVTGTYITFTLRYKYDKKTFDKMTNEYEKAVDKILDKLTDDMSAYKKIKTIHDSIIDGTVYNYDADNSDNIYGTLVGKKSKCDGYAKTFSYICSRAGIKSVNVIGEVNSGKKKEYHMWNKVCCNKKWYNVDLTWDDPISNMKNNKIYDYFMLCDKDMEKTHEENNFNFEAPEAYDNSKGYFTVNKKCADDFDSAKALIRKGIVSAAKKGETKVMIKCSSKETFISTKKYVMNNSKLSPVLESIKNKNNPELISGVYTYGFNNNYYIITVNLFYEDTDLDDYFTSTKKADKTLLKDLAKFGIK